MVIQSIRTIKSPLVGALFLLLCIQTSAKNRPINLYFSPSLVLTSPIIIENKDLKSYFKSFPGQSIKLGFGMNYSFNDFQFELGIERISYGVSFYQHVNEIIPSTGIEGYPTARFFANPFKATKFTLGASTFLDKENKRRIGTSIGIDRMAWQDFEGTYRSGTQLDDGTSVTEFYLELFYTRRYFYSIAFEYETIFYTKKNDRKLGVQCRYNFGFHQKWISGKLAFPSNRIPLESAVRIRNSSLSIGFMYYFGKNRNSS